MPPMIAEAAGQLNAGLGTLALILVLALLVAGAAYYVAWRALRNPYKALLVSGSTFGCTITLLVLLFANFSAIT